MSTAAHVDDKFATSHYKAKIHTTPTKQRSFKLVNQAPPGLLLIACKQRDSKYSPGVCPLHLSGSAMEFRTFANSSGVNMWINSWLCTDVCTVHHTPSLSRVHKCLSCAGVCTIPCTQSLLRLHECLSCAGVWLSEHVKCCLTQRSTTSMARLRQPSGSVAGTAMGVTLRGWLPAPLGPPWPTPSCMCWMTSCSLYL